MVLTKEKFVPFQFKIEIKAFIWAGLHVFMGEGVELICGITWYALVQKSSLTCAHFLLQNWESTYLSFKTRRKFQFLWWS